MKTLLAITLVIPIVALLILSSPAVTAQIACIRLAYTVNHTTHFEWRGDAATSCTVLR